MSRSLTVQAVEGLGEVAEGDDLAVLVAQRHRLQDGDVLVVTSKVVSKAEGRVRAMDRDAAVTDETDREVARRGPTRIVRNRLGLVMAAAGVDASNIRLGSVALLPEDPDASARRLRDRLAEVAGVDVAVVVSDTSGRAWRHGQTDLAVGAAGLHPLHELAGTRDGYGNELAVTAPAVADEIAGAGDLVKGKLAHCPVAVVRGLAHLVLPRGEHGVGAAGLVREEETDMFGLGAREAVVAAVGLDADDGRGFGAPAPAGVLAATLAGLAGDAGTVVGPSVPGAPLEVEVLEADPRRAGRLEARLAAAAYAHGWLEQPTGSAGSLRFAPRTP
jgi:coenzyme F420-0:L-glutamate ligase/coenzyme F420-1:gamma-L-glutamate ligase